ncbi:nucleotidyl transferase AbiEii/AbiGii toxin family protein [Halanaerobium sp. Z-7514]|uniref:Nucleotidyl transferase AbiEii/AbiGii toxin family protein n=1 Tax=Halanaerobium polyolivorans TaxID=2886943 RepID=A0AAW4X1H0_9FIRM|nr:nucleotidyl transferase AbiEii/AbiGii toxin family protein [Halanaerobium polyolivorans]MCC3145674.1 nucleotidyl transferase AbiEii/AbiGii toxin family protein [Halanaerobium polyolivorans]
MKDLAASVLARLKNKSKDKKIPFQQILILFAQEELLRKISLSEYKSNFILKGGLLIYSLSRFEARPTIDSDYLVKNISAEGEEFKKKINNILDINTGNDFIEFEIKDIELINEQKKYTGTRVNLISKIKNTKTYIHLDFGTGDTVEPPERKMKLPVLLSDFQKPEIYVYSIESVIAEKLDAIISRMETTSRMKDFYDIYSLALKYDFEFIDVKKALSNTLNNRSTNIDINSIDEINRLAQDEMIISRWNNFCKKVLKSKIEINQVIETLISLLNPPYKAIFNGSNLNLTWSHEKRKYI